jgi:hypothetical protein
MGGDFFKEDAEGAVMAKPVAGEEVAQKDPLIEGAEPGTFILDREQFRESPEPEIGFKSLEEFRGELNEGIFVFKVYALGGEIFCKRKGVDLLHHKAPIKESGALI